MITVLDTSVQLAKRTAVIFDFDGTLADTMPSIVETARRVLLEFGLAEDELGDLARLVGPPFPQAFSQIYGVTPEEAVEITARYRRIYNVKGKEAWPLFDGVPEMLTQLRMAGRRLVIASSKANHLVNRAVAENDLTAYFEAICGKLSDINYSKADAIAASLDALSCGPSDAIMVGDRYHDAYAARELGIPCVGVLWGKTGSAEELIESGCVALTDTVDGLASLLVPERGNLVAGN